MKIGASTLSGFKDNIGTNLEYFEELGLDHPGSIPFLGRDFEDKIFKLNKQSIEEIGEYGKDLGVNAAIENMPTFEGYIYSNPYELNELVTSLDMSMTLDIGHANHAGYGPEDMYFDSIKHIHAHDNNGDDDSHYALGDGSIDLKSIISTFEDKKYNGTYIIEVNEKDWVKKSYDYLKNNF